MALHQWQCLEALNKEKEFGLTWLSNVAKGNLKLIDLFVHMKDDSNKKDDNNYERI